MVEFAMIRKIGQLGKMEGWTRSIQQVFNQEFFCFSTASDGWAIVLCLNMAAADCRMHIIHDVWSLRSVRQFECVH